MQPLSGWTGQICLLLWTGQKYPPVRVKMTSLIVTTRHSSVLPPEARHDAAERPAADLPQRAVHVGIRARSEDRQFRGFGRLRFILVLLFRGRISNRLGVKRKKFIY